MIELINLYKSFNNGHPVLRDLNLTIETGETMVVIGRSGVGKSVTLKLIIGLQQPDQGQVFVDGVDIARLSRHERSDLLMKFGMLFQSAALFDSMTVEENVGFVLLHHRKAARSTVRERVRECLQLVGLEGVEDLRPAELSGGMRKRVGLARALCMKPEIILYDEPTTGVDPIGADAINELIRNLRDRLNVTSVVVTHDMTSAYKIADRIAMLYEGRIIEVGTPEEIKRTTNRVVRQFITGAAEGPITADVYRPGTSRRNAW